MYHQMIEQSKLASLALSSSSLKKIQSISLCLKWRRREKERSGDREMFCIHWFILQVSTMAEDGQGQVRNLEFSSYVDESDPST